MAQSSLITTVGHLVVDDISTVAHEVPGLSAGFGLGPAGPDGESVEVRGSLWLLYSDPEMPPLKDWIWPLADCEQASYEELGAVLGECANVCLLLGTTDAEEDPIGLGRDRVLAFGCTSSEFNHWGIAHAYLLAGALPPVALIDHLKAEHAPTHDPVLFNLLAAALFRSLRVAGNFLKASEDRLVTLTKEES